MPGLSSFSVESLLAQGRVQLLFSRAPAGIASGLLGIFLIFVLLLEAQGMETARAWAAYMLSVLGYRGWLWYAFAATNLDVSSPRKWEFAFAVGTLLTGLGWGFLNGPIYPDSISYGPLVILVAAVTVSFTASIYYGISHGAFWSLAVPTLLPALGRFLTQSGVANLFAWALALACIGVLATAQLAHRRTVLDNLRRRVISEALLGEQQAIFQSANAGIAVIQDGRLMKFNERLGELLGQRGEALLVTPLMSHFADGAELDRFIRESAAAHERGRPSRGVFRLRRADGVEFWAEVAARRMEGMGPPRSVWIISDLPLQASPGMRPENVMGEAAAAG